MEPFVRALGILQSAVADPKSVGLTDPHSVPPDSAQGQKGQSKGKRASSTSISYAGAVKGPADGKSQPIGAKIVQTEPAKTLAKSSSGAIEALAPAKAPPKAPGETVVPGSMSGSSQA